MTLYYRIDGADDAPVVVLLHSIATSGAVWDLQVPVWSQRFRLIRIDLPGHGRSPPGDDATLATFASDVWNTLDRLSIGSAVVVGLSLGGMVAQEMAIAAPERVAALVVAHSGGRSSPAVAALWEERIALAQARGIEALVASTLERWFTPEFARSSSLQLEWIAAQIRCTSVIGFCQAARAIQALDTLDRLRTLTMPALVVAGIHDTALPIDASQAVVTALPAATFVTLPSAHLGNVEQAGRFTETVGRFLSDHARG